jgi:hypothetical protein
MNVYLSIVYIVTLFYSLKDLLLKCRFFVKFFEYNLQVSHSCYVCTRNCWFANNISYTVCRYVRFESFTANKCAKIFSGDQPCQCWLLIYISTLTWMIARDDFSTICRYVRVLFLHQISRIPNSSCSLFIGSNRTLKKHFARLQYFYFHSTKKNPNKSCTFFDYL